MSGLDYCETQKTVNTWKMLFKLIVYRPKKMLFIWVSMYLAGEYHLGTLFLYGTAILRGHPSHEKV